MIELRHYKHDTLDPMTAAEAHGIRRQLVALPVVPARAVALIQQAQWTQ